MQSSVHARFALVLLGSPSVAPAEPVAELGALRIRKMTIVHPEPR